MKTTVDLSLVLPCYREAGLFADSVRKIRSVLDCAPFSYELMFVDDCGGDDTRDLIVSECKKHANSHAVYHERNEGRGKAVKDGILASKGRVVGYIDIDCEVSPVYIPQMTARILDEKSDVVIGKRYYRTSIRALFREILSRGYRWLSDRMIGTRGMDTETGYKFFSRKKIVPILRLTEHTGWFWDTEIMTYAIRAGLTIEEVPVLFIRRFDKVSSVRVVHDTLEYMRELVQFRTRLSRL